MEDDYVLIDPRGIAAHSHHPLADRQTGGDSARFLLIDNGKLAPSYGPYAVIADVLVELFPTGSWVVTSLDLLQHDHTEIDGIADKLITAHKPTAVVLALADAGVSVQTTLLATVLETRGVPTLVLATPLGDRVCRPIAQSYTPGLPIVVLDTERTDASTHVRDLMLAKTTDIRVALAEVPKTGGVVAAAGLAAEYQSEWTSASDDLGAFQDWLEASGLGDGLPLLPPTRGAVDRLLSTVPDDPDEVIYGPALTSGRNLRVRDAAINAAMTACPTLAFPVVVAALRAMARSDFRLSQAAITTHPSGYAIVLSGVDPARFGLSGGAGCLGPGHRGNASVGRAVSLTVQHLFGARPGGSDLTIFGSPAEFSYCFAEDLQGIRWDTLAAEQGSAGPGVLVMKAEGPRNVLEHLATTPIAICEALTGAATSICSNNAYVPGDLLVIVNPEHARILAGAGWGKQDLAKAIHERARLPRAMLDGRGVGPFRPRYMDILDVLPVTRSPRDVHVVVAGAPGPQSMVALPWGYSRAQWQPIVTSQTRKD